MKNKLRQWTAASAAASESLDQSDGRPHPKTSRAGGRFVESLHDGSRAYWGHELQQENGPLTPALSPSEGEREDRRQPVGHGRVLGRTSVLLLWALLGLWLAPTPAQAAFTLATAVNLTNLYDGAVAWGDYDNDGDLDLVMTGLDGNDHPVSLIYSNCGNSTFVQSDIVLPGLYAGAVAWGDYDNDGYLDLLVTGATSLDYPYQPISRLYRNQGNGTFTDSGIALEAVDTSAVAWGDYDNDGHPDIVLTGWSSSGQTSRIYRNNGDGTFADSGIPLTPVYNGAVAWDDYDNDGRLDLLLTGSSSSGPVAKLYRNNGDGTFSAQTPAQLGVALIGVESGGVAWGDYDNDGNLDFVLTGLDFDYNPVALIYHNGGNGTFAQSGIVLTNVDSSSVAWGDYNHDGKLDLALMGYADTGYVCVLYRNQGNGTFTAVPPAELGVSLPNLAVGSLAWGDYDLDGDLDLLLTGLDNSYQPVSALYRNDQATSNALPAVLNGLKSVVHSGKVTFSWNPGTDDHTPATGLSYNLRVSTVANGCNALSPLANATSGLRRVMQLGNVGQTTNWTIQGLPEGTNYWSVQAIDNAFRGGPFTSEQSFVMDRLPPTILACPTNRTITGACQAALPDLTGEVVATDAATPSANLVITQSPAPGTLVSLGPINLVVFTVRDSGSNAATCHALLTGVDRTPPAFPSVTNVTVLADPGQCHATVAYALTATDACDPNPLVSYEPPSGSIFPVGTTPVACWASDASGNSSTCAFTVTVRDTLQITCPSNLVANPDPGHCSKSNVIYAVSATDLCAGTNVIVTCSPPSGSTFDAGTTPVTCWATDAWGNSNSCTFNVTVNACGPSSCPTSYTNTIYFGLEVTNFIANQLDNGSNTVAEVLTNLPDFTTLYKWDRCQQTWATEVNMVIGGFWTDPSMTLAPGEGAYLATLGQTAVTFTGWRRCARQLPLPLVHGLQLVSDQMPEAGTFESIVGLPPLEGTTVYRWAGGTYFVYSYLFGLWDPEPPTAGVGEAWLLDWPGDTLPITCPSNIVASADLGHCSKSNVTYTVSATDLCGNNVPVACSSPSGSTFAVGTTAVVCRATDAWGNSNSCTFNVTVNPLTNCGPDSCPASYPITLYPGVTNCIANQLDNGNNTLAEILTNVPDGTTLYKFDRCQQRVSDLVATFYGPDVGWDNPSVTLAPGEGAFLMTPDQVTLTITGRRRCTRQLPLPLVHGFQVVSDQLPEAGTFATIVGLPPLDGTTVYRLSGGSYQPYYYEDGVWYPEAPMAQAGEAWWLDWPGDTQPPRITCPSNIVANADLGHCSKSNVTYTVSATECAGPTPTIVCSPTNGSTFPVGTTLVTCWAIDAWGNSNRCSFTVTIRGTQPPQITCPSDLVVTVDPGHCDKTNVTYTVSATDLCGNDVPVACSSPSGSTFAVGTTAVVCRANDAWGNSNSCTFNVTVNPLTNCGPDSCPASYPITLYPGATNLIANQLDNGGNTLAEVLTNVPDGTTLWKYDPCAQVYGPVQTFYAGAGWFGEDANPSTATLAPGEGAFLVTPEQFALLLTGRRRCARQLPLPLVHGLQVVSDQLPEAGNFDTIVGLPPIEGTAVYRWWDGGYQTYAYEGGVWSPEAPTAERGEAWWLFWPGDTQPPQITCPSNIVASADLGQCSRSNVTYTASATDCAGPTPVIAYSPTNGSTFPVGTTPVTCWAIDASGNSNSCTFTVSVYPTALDAAGATWTPRPVYDRWSAVASSADGAKLVAVASSDTFMAFGPIYTSTDAGATWAVRESARFWSAVASSADGTRLVATEGSDLYQWPGQIYTSTDSGLTWVPRESARLWSAVASSANGMKLVATEGAFLSQIPGQLYTSTDSGVTWTVRGSARYWSAVASSADGTKLVAAEAGGQLYTSTDSGATWTARASARLWAAVASSADGTKLVAVEGSDYYVIPGQIYTSTDSGVTWAARESPRVWSAVASSADGTRLVAVEGATPGMGPPGRIYTSTDSGLTWTARESPRYWSAVASSADGTKVVAAVTSSDSSGSPGQIYTSVGPVVPVTNPPTILGATNRVALVGAPVTYGVTATNICQPNVPVICVPPSGSTFPPGTNTVTCVAVDALGVTNTASFTVIVDTTPPSITCAGNKTVQCGTTWSFDRPTASGVCCGTNLNYWLVGSNLVSSGWCQNVWAGLWQVSDCCSNYSAICTQLVTVVNCLTNYTVTISKSCSLIADQLDCAGGNTLANIMPSLPCNARFMKWDNASQAWITTTYSPSRGWADGTITLKPGEGAFLCPCCTNAFSVTFTGCLPTPNLPVAMVSDHSYLLSRQYPGPGTYESIVGLVPEDFTSVYMWDGTNGQWQHQPFQYLGGTWDPREPIAAVGEAMMICPPEATLPVLPTTAFPYPVGIQLSANVVGYVQLSVPAGGSSLIANPLNTTNNTLGGGALPLPPTADVLLYKWSPGGGQWGNGIAGIGGVWSDPSVTLNPGEGALLCNGESPLNLTFVGEVLEGNLTNPVPSGANVISSLVPQARPLGTNGQAGTLRFPASPNDIASLYNAGSWISCTVDPFGLVWTTTNLIAQDPFIGVAQAFLCQKAVAADWIQNFVVSHPCGPRLAIALRPTDRYVTVTWGAPPEWQLQWADDLEGQWHSLYGQASPFTFLPDTNVRFFRLARPVLWCRLTSTNTFLLSWRGPGYQLQKRPSSAPSWTDVPAVPVLVGDEYQVSLDDLSGWVIETCSQLYITNNCITNVTYNVGACTNWFVTNFVTCVNGQGTNFLPNVVAYCTNGLFFTTGYGWYLTNSAGITPNPGCQQPTFYPTNEPTFFRLRSK
jgi:hypothetical protein